MTEAVAKVPTVEAPKVVESAIDSDTTHTTVTEAVAKVPVVEAPKVVESAIASDTSHPNTVTETVAKVPSVEPTKVVENAILPDTTTHTTANESVVKVGSVEPAKVVETVIAPDHSSTTTTTNVTSAVTSTSTVEHSTVVTTSTTQTPSAVNNNSTTPTSGIASTTEVAHSAQTTTPATNSPTVTTTQTAPPVQAPPVKVAVPKPPVTFDFPKANQPLIGVIDTGFSANNIDIDYSQIKSGHDYIDNDANPLVKPTEGNDPGTQALGIIAAKQNNGIGINGINDDAPLWVGRAEVNSDQWAQSLMEFVDAAKASKQPNAVVNLSFNLTNLDGTPRFELTGAERAALAYAQHNNVLIVASAGDNPGEMSAIGQASLEFDNIVTVGSADRVNNSVALSKAYDRAEYSGSGYALDIVAPGGTDEKPITVTSGNGVTKDFGTSVATAKVSGAASQVWAANPDLSYRQVIDILKRTATDLKTPNWDLETGAGLLNIAAAVHLAKVTPAIDVDVPVRYDFKKSDQPLIGIIDTGFISKNPDIDYRRIILGRDRVDNDNNPLLQNSEGSEHGSHILGIIGATQGNGIGIDGMNDDAPIWLGRAIGSGKWAESLREFVDAAKASGQPNAVVNLSFDLTQINPDGSVTTRYELTPQEREALEYARQNGVMVVVAAGNNGGTMSALGQASQEFDNVITVGSIDYNGNRADYSNFGFGLDFVARGGTPDQPVMSTVGEGADLGLLSGEEEPLEDEMSTIARNTFEEVFGPFSAPQELESDEQELENLTPEERQVYDEATKEIDQLLKDYLGAASQKIALEYVDGYYAASVDALSQFVDAFDENLADNLIKAEEILGNAGFSTNASTTTTNLDFSIPLDLGVGEMAGTSVAAAKVTGAVSQVWAANPGLSYPQVKEILQKTAVDLNSRGWDAATGSGLVNVEAAIELAKRTQPQPYQPKPIQSPLTWSGEGKVTPGERAVSVSVPTFTGRVMNAGYVTETGWLRIRSGPSTNNSPVGLKYPGDAIDFDAYENNGGWVPDPYMPGGGSSRWYKIAGTNNWMSALYIDNTPERVEQERQRLEAIRRAEEEARRAEEEARRAEEEARRAEEELQRILEQQRLAEEEARRRIEEELRRILEEQRRQQEQFQAAISQVSQKVGDVGAQLGGYVSNGVRVYQFDKGTLWIQPDGSSAFYEAGKKVAEFFDPNKEGSFGNYIWNPAYPIGVNIDNNVSRGIDNANRIEQLGKLLAYPGFSEGMNGFVLNPPRFGKYSNYVDNVFSFISTYSKNWDEFIEGKTFTNPGKNGFVFKTPGALAKGTGWLAKSGTIGNVLGLVPTAWEFLQAKNDQEKGKALIKGGAGILGSMAGGYIGATLFAPILPPAGSVVGGIAGSLLGGYLGEKGGEWVADNWPSIRQNVESGWNATTSAFSSAVEAAKAKAQGALEKAKAAAATAKAAYEVATTTVQQAKVAYQTFKQEIQKQTTQIVQQSQQKIKEEAQKILSRVTQNPVVQQGSKVVKQIANYAQKAVQAVGGIINGAKQFANNIINTGKKMVNNVIETGKKAYETVKNVVTNTYETGKKVVTETYNKAVQAVNTVKDTVSNGFNAVKSVFRFGW
ncbi:S8 family serine peptidase [Argonema antarcticum]|uniref:S8 family serine peptidase n=1 Tax=Argonema antarcticum TaxID=2942763 RepID=UPI002011099B|nr:S8 family serine peptidase [Argonema antarcticum A004/B2]